MSEPYEYLASVYDGGWFAFSQYVSELVGSIEAERGRTFSRVCDAACGTGLFLYFLCRHYPGEAVSRRRLCGFDRSEEMLKRAMERLPEGEFARGDLRGEFPFTGPFDLISCVYDSLNYLTTPAEIRAFFEAALGRLSGDGMLLIDFNTLEMYEGRHGMVQPHLIGGRTFRETITVESGPPPLVTTTFTFPEGREIHRQRPWAVAEIEALLEETGFRIVDMMDVMDMDSTSNEPSGKVVVTTVPA